MNPMQPQQVTRERAFLIAKHECGHWLMATRLGFVAHDIEITITDLVRGHRGEASITLQTELKSVAEVRSYGRRRIGVLFAGALAESLLPDGQINWQYAIGQLEGEQGGAKDDFSKIRELLRILRSIEFQSPGSEEEHETQLKALQTPLWDRSADIIERDHEVLLGMAQSIVSRFKGIGVPFGMKEQEIRELPSIKAWMETVASDQYWLNF